MLIKRERSIIPACDFSDLELFEKIVRETADIEAVGGYKIGFRLGYRYSVPKIVQIIRKNYAEDMKSFGVDAIILFPQAGPTTQRAWTEAAQQAGLTVIVGGEMTHPSYKRSEGGYIDDEALEEIYINAAEQGVTDFVVPGNKLNRIQLYKELLESKGVKPTFYAPGFVAQKGEISEATKLLKRWHAIVGRGIYEAHNIRKA